jgi:hypothetical protein
MRNMINALAPTMRQLGIRLAAFTALAVIASAIPAASQDAKPKPVRMTAFAINLGSGPNAGTLDIVLERLSSDDERANLIAAFNEKGQDLLLKELQKIKPRVGYIRTPNSLGYDLQYAYLTQNADGTRRVVIATDRWIGYWEASRQARTMDYPFTLIEIRLDQEGKGEGRMAVGVQITKSKDGKTVELENYGISPVALKNVSIQK